MSENQFPQSPLTGDYVSQLPVPPGLPLNSRIDHYKLLEQIGEGGFGVVYVAEQTEPVRRKVALKVIKPGMDSREVILRFEAERHALALMDHPNIAKVFDAGTTPTGRPYFVMELVKGVAITQFCDQNRLPPRERLELFISVCQAIQHAHQKGIIHRDIKPSNIMVALQDGKPVAKVIDFGVAKALHQKLTEQSIYTSVAQMIGTPLYMSPEQAEMTSLDIDTRSDIYSLGVLLYELLTGVTPFDRQRFAKAAFDEIRRVIREEEPPKPSTRLSSSESIASVSAQRRSEPAKLSKLVRGDLDWITMKCLEKDRGRRYETANGLAMDIQRYLADEPVNAGPPSRLYRMQKFVRRNRGAVIAAGLLLLALVGGVIGTTIGLVRARHESDQKEIARLHADEQRQTAEAISKFLENDLLELADAHKQAGANMLADPDMKVKTLVIRAAKQMEGRFVDRPSVEASLRTTIGNALRAVGESAEAIPHLERAVNLRKQLHGAGTIETLDTIAFLARAQMDAGKLDEALPNCEKVRDECQLLFGETNDSTLAAMNDLAHLYQVRGNPNRALPMFQRVLELRKQQLGTDHDDTLLSMNNLGFCYFGLSQYDKSLEVHQQTHQLRLKKHGEDHPDTIASLNNFSTAMLALGQIQPAMPHLQKALDLHRKRVGPSHPDTWQCMDNLSWAHQALGQNGEAIALGEEALKRRLEKLEPNHPDTLQSYNNLGAVYFGIGDFARCLAMHEKAYEGRRVKLSPEHQFTLISMENVATSHLALGSSDKAIPLLEKLEEINNRLHPGVDNRETLHGLSSLGSAYLDSGQINRALPLLERTVEKYKTALPPNHPESLQAMYTLARAYQAAGKNEQSISLYAETLAARRKALPPYHSQTMLNACALAANYISLERFGEAEKILREEMPPANSKQAKAWNGHQMRAILGIALLKQNNLAEAEPMLLDGYRGMKDTPATIPIPIRNKRLAECLTCLCQIYESTNQPEAARKWKKELEGLQAAAAKP